MPGREQTAGSCGGPTVANVQEGRPLETKEHFVAVHYSMGAPAATTTTSMTTSTAMYAVAEEAAPTLTGGGGGARCCVFIVVSTSSPAPRVRLPTGEASAVVDVSAVSSATRTMVTDCRTVAPPSSMSAGSDATSSAAVTTGSLPPPLAVGGATMKSTSIEPLRTSVTVTCTEPGGYQHVGIGMAEERSVTIRLNGLTRLAANPSAAATPPSNCVTKTRYASGSETDSTSFASEIEAEIVPTGSAVTAGAAVAFPDAAAVIAGDPVEKRAGVTSATFRKISPMPDA